MNEGKLFVGRRKELAKLQKAYSNKGHVLITGEAGIGKTALLRQARVYFPLLLCEETSSLGRICEDFERQFGWSHRKLIRMQSPRLESFGQRILAFSRTSV